MEKQKKSNRWWLWIFIPGFYLMIFYGLGSMGESGNSSEKPTGSNTIEVDIPEKKPAKVENWGSDENKRLVYSLAMDEIEKTLNDPKSAEFPDYAERAAHVQYLGENVYQINSYLRAKNAFGALILKRFTVKVRYDKESYSVYGFQTL